MKRAAILAAALLAGAAHAEIIGLHLASVHSMPDYNNSNTGIYYRESTGFTAGAYYNSQWRQSAYMGITRQIGPVDVSLLAITGYREADVMPAVIPSYAFAIGGGVALRTSLILNPGDGPHALHFSLEYSTK